MENFCEETYSPEDAQNEADRVLFSKVEKQIGVCVDVAMKTSESDGVGRWNDGWLGFSGGGGRRGRARGAWQTFLVGPFRIEIFWDLLWSCTSKCRDKIAICLPPLIYARDDNSLKSTSLSQ
ncbi:Uncharacterized protein Adt_40997 [Abeliophyllum distichum]|uniref:Uncharacterized protein n=1 Tax=Abeliophyllum distichum TaxID=126358 RepID=A0ABD1PRH2_9LAMI